MRSWKEKKKKHSTAPPQELFLHWNWSSLYFENHLASKGGAGPRWGALQKEIKEKDGPKIYNNC